MLRRIIQKFIMIIQKILITIALFFLYIFGFGVTVVLCMLFYPRLLSPKRSKDTFWNEAEGYSPDMRDCLRGS